MRKFILPGLLAAWCAFLIAATYAPTKFTVTNMTKRATYSVKAIHGMTYQTSAATTVYLNGTGSGWPVAANTPTDFYTFRNISTLAFTCSSTAAASPTKLYVQEF